MCTWPRPNKSRTCCWRSDGCAKLTFRGVNEGTGRARDLDRFDDYYLHLFVWNREKQEVVGAYRLGRTDVIVKRLGLHGLYTSTLFHYRKKLLDRINPALEMGRSFVRRGVSEELSRSLLLLWKGHGLFRGAPSAVPQSVRPGQHQQ
jgi:putative hemolysin